MDNITYGLNGAEVERHTIYVAYREDGSYVHHASEPFDSRYNYVEEDEFVCGDCGCVVASAEGHESWECDEAARERAEDMAADYRD